MSQQHKQKTASINTAPTQSMCIEETRINLFYFFSDGPDPDEIDVSKLCLPLPEQLLPAMEAQQIKEAAIWKRKPLTMAGDLLPNIRQLFAQGEHQAVETWVLHTDLLKLLNGSTRLLKRGEKPLVLTLNLADVACKRLGNAGCKPEAPRITIEGVQYHRFRTGLGVAIVDIGLGNADIPVELLQESIHALTRKNTIGWHMDDGNELPVCVLSNRQTRNAPTMGKLVRGLLGCNTSSSGTRVYSHTFLRMLPGIDNDTVEKQLVYLARHYTQDYQFSGDLGETTLFRDFENVLHCVANEGMATAVLVDSDPEFLVDYYNKVSRPAHLPICLLNYHAEYAIQHFMSRAGVWFEAGKVPKLELSDMLEQQRALINFDSHFFSPVVSKINTHNRLHRAMQKIKYLDQQHQIVSRTTKLINSLIMAEQKSIEAKAIQKRSLRYCRLGASGIAAAAYLTVFSITSETLEVLEKEWLDGHLPGWLEHGAGTISLSLAIIIGGISLCVALCQCKNQKKERHEEDATEKLLEVLHIHHLNNKGS